MKSSLKSFYLLYSLLTIFFSFLTVYKADPELFCWFEFLNQGDLNEDLLGISKKFLFSKKEDVKNNEISSFSNIRENNNEYLNKNLGEIEKEISKCIELIKEG